MQSTYILSRKIQQLSNTITQRRNRDLKKLDLTADQADALLFFHAHPESAAADLKTCSPPASLRMMHATKP